MPRLSAKAAAEARAAQEADLLASVATPSPSADSTHDPENTSEQEPSSTVATSCTNSPISISPALEAADPGLISLSQAAVTSQRHLLGLLLKHTNDDLNAYTYDRDYCTHQLQTEASLLPAEARALQLRILDANHHIRHCQQKAELIHFEARTGLNPSLVLGEKGAVQAFVPPSAPVIVPIVPEPVHVEDPEVEAIINAPMTKRRRKSEWVGDDSTPFRVEETEGDDSGVQVTRLGFWKCRLCTSQKFLRAGPGRQPSGPCKWPLKDVAKMIAHFTEMHHEHLPRERCAELGDALHRNRGPFEYWLRRSHSLSGADSVLIDDCVSTLRSGKLPAILRKLSRAAASFPEE